MSARADACSACGTQLQPLEPSSSWYELALTHAREYGIHKPAPILLALIAHTAVVHDDLTELPALQPWKGK